MLGNPKYKLGDKVSFILKDTDDCEQIFNGEIYIIDKYGTFEDDTDVSYDILVNDCDKYPNGCLFKHIQERLILNK